MGNVESAVDFCVDSCKDAGFAYAGLQFRTHCFCGNSFGKHGQVALNECNMNCPGQKNEKCGSGWRNNVYLTGLLEPSDEDESKAEKDQRKAKSAAHRHGIHESWEAYDRCPKYLSVNGEDDQHFNSIKRSGLECLHERQNY